MRSAPPFSPALSIFLLFLLLGCTAAGQPTAASPEGLPSQTAHLQFIAAPTTSPSPLFPPGSTCLPENELQPAELVRVVDGDTIEVRFSGSLKSYSVRYIGIDTPETYPIREPYGLEAEDKNSELLQGGQLYLVKDVSETDRYGRLLRYVVVGNLFVNYELIRQGYATTLSYPPDISCSQTFLEAEREARAAQAGFWSVTPVPGN